MRVICSYVSVRFQFCSGICIKLESEVAVPIVNSWSSDVVLSTENIHETLYGSLTQASSDTLTGTNPALQDAETRSPIDVTSSHNLTGTLQTPPVSDGNALTKTVPVNAVVVSSDTFSSTVTSVGSVLDGNGNGFRNGFHQAEVPTDNGNTLPTAERDPSIELEVNLSEGCSSNSGNTLVRCTSIQRNVGILASPSVARSTRSKTKVCSNSKAKTSDLLECNIKFPAETSSSCFTLGSDGKESSSSSFTNGATKVSSNRSGGSRSSQKQQRLFDLRAKACVSLLFVILFKLVITLIFAFFLGQQSTKEILPHSVIPMINFYAVFLTKFITILSTLKGLALV